MKYPAVVLALVALTAQASVLQERREAKRPGIEVSFTSAARNEPVTGMVYLAVSRDNRTPPIQQTDPTGVPLFSKYVDQLTPGVTVSLGPDDRGHPVPSLRDVPAGDYWVQPFVNVYTRFARADG